MGGGQAVGWGGPPRQVGVWQDWRCAERETGGPWVWDSPRLRSHADAWRSSSSSGAPRSWASVPGLTARPWTQESGRSGLSGQQGILGKPLPSRSFSASERFPEVHRPVVPHRGSKGRVGGGGCGGGGSWGGGGGRSALAGMGWGHRILLQRFPGCL